MNYQPIKLSLTIALLGILGAFPAHAESDPCPTFEADSVDCFQPADYDATQAVTRLSESAEFLALGSTIFIHANRVITLTNDHSLITDSCRYIGKETIWSLAPADRPIDPVSEMAWYMSVLNKYPGNVLLANFKFDSLWSYEC